MQLSVCADLFAISVNVVPKSELEPAHLNFDVMLLRDPENELKVICFITTTFFYLRPPPAAPCGLHTSLCSTGFPSLRLPVQDFATGQICACCILTSCLSWRHACRPCQFIQNKCCCV